MNPRAIRTMQASLEALGISYTPEQISLLGTYLDMLKAANKTMNLIGEASDNEVVHKHIIDSLMPMAQHPEAVSLMKGHLLDAGAGAGLPGIPLLIMNHGLRIVLVESRLKKNRFLQDVIQNLKLENAETIAERLEDIAHDPAFREQFDIVVARALGNLALLAELCLPFVALQGFLVAYKGPHYREEVEESAEVLATLGGALEDIREFSLPRTEFNRSLLYIKKVQPTPQKFPRRAGIPQKRPLR